MAEVDVAPQAPAAAPPQAPAAETEPQEKPATPSAVRRANRMEQVRAVLSKQPTTPLVPPPSDKGEPPAAETKETSTPEKAADKLPAAEPAPSTEAGKAKAWADVMERENKARQAREAVKREREEFAKERALFETERKDAREAAELLAKDPVAYAAKFGGKDFGKRLVDHTLDEKARTVEQQAAKLAEIDSKLERLTKQEQDRASQASVSAYLGEHRTHWKTDKESAVLGAWYSEDEIDSVVQSIAERHASATNEVLTPQKLAGNLRHELKVRLERLAKTEAGQEFLRQFVGPPPASAKTRPPAEAPKTLSKDLTTQGTPPGDGRLRKLNDKDRSDLIRQVLSQRQG